MAEPNDRRTEVAHDDKPERLLRLRTVLDRTGLSRSTLYRKIESGTFPPQVKIAMRCSAWRETAVEAWIADPGAFSEK